jgi:hypothetical protein
MALSKKHFELIAAGIRQQVDKIRNTEKLQPLYEHGYALSHLETLAVGYCAHFRDENPLFDSHRFLNACGF